MYTLDIQFSVYIGYAVLYIGYAVLYLVSVCRCVISEPQCILLVYASVVYAGYTALGSGYLNNNKNVWVIALVLVPITVCQGFINRSFVGLN